MSDPIAQVTFSLSWMDSAGNNIRPQPRIVQAPYSVVLQGQIPVYDAMATGTELDLPFTGCPCGVALCVIENQTGQELNMAWGGNWSPHFPDKGAIIHAFPLIPSAGSMTALRFMLTQNQVGLGKINYLVFGR